MEIAYLREILLFLVVAGLLVPALQRIRISPVLGFLLIGLAVGPFGLARFADHLPWLSTILVTDVEGVRHISEIGVVFLLFMIGLELSFDRLLAMRQLVFGLGVLQIAISAVVITGIALLWDNSVEAAIVLGACLALSSTAIVIQLLTEQQRFGSPVGHASFAILLAQDLAVVPLLFIVGLLGASTGDSILASLGIAIFQAVVAIVVILGLGRLLIRPLFRFVGGLHSPEAFLSATLLVIAVTSLTSYAAGLSAALGAFLVGLLLAETEYRHEIEHLIAPFKGLLLGLFFISVGMGIDLLEIVANPVWIPLSIVGLVLIKAGIVALLARWFGFSWATAVESGLLLGQGGEFAFVIITLAITLAIVPLDTAQFMLIVVSGTMLLTPAIASLARRIGHAMQSPNDHDLQAVPNDLGGHVVVCGYGRVGRLLARAIEAQHIPHIALELDPDRVATYREKDIAIFHADASRPGILNQIHIPTASAFVITMDDHDAAERVLRTARSVAPELPIIMRARDPEHAAELMELGANYVIPEVFEAGMHMAQNLLQSIGYPEEAARGVIEMLREESQTSPMGS